MQDEQTSNWIAYNGEVFNFRDIRCELESRGVRFHSDSDTEVVLKAYGVFGSSCVERFRGMFAFAIWDASRQELFLCRDRVGLKPLYYTTLAEVLVFGSEVRALLASRLVERRLDPVGLETFLANGFVVSPHTMVVGVRSLLPGTWIRVRTDGKIAETCRYWKLAAHGTKRSAPELVDEARGRLDEAVRLRMVSDVPLGAFLSGGMDSSTVVALMKASGGDVRTFAVTFEEAAYDESRYSRWTADRFGTRHSEVRLQRQAFYDMVRDALAAMDQPTFDGLNTYCVARAARETGLKVALSGLGADELFGGYSFFNSARYLARMKSAVEQLPRPLVHTIVDRLSKRGLVALAGPWKAASLLTTNNNSGRIVDFRLAAYQTAQFLFPFWARQALTVPNHSQDGMEPSLGLPPEFVDFVAQEIDGETDTAGVLSKLALRLFLGERCLRDTDSMTMGVSLEVRAPFTDHLLIEGLTRFVGGMRCLGAPNKPLLRRIVEPFLGPDYPARRKQGFIFPFKEWLPGWEGFREFTGSHTAMKSLAEYGLDDLTVGKLFDRFRVDPGGTRWSRIWAIFVLTEWLRANRIHR